MEIQLYIPPRSEIVCNSYNVMTIYNSIGFWFNPDLHLAIPMVKIPMSHNRSIQSQNRSIRSQNRRIYRERVALKKKRMDAINVIERWWQVILAKRMLNRLKLINEIHLLPRIGLLYEQAHQHFTSCSKSKSKSKDSSSI